MTKWRELLQAAGPCRWRESRLWPAPMLTGMPPEMKQWLWPVPHWPRHCAQALEEGVLGSEPTRTE
eukprot:6457619-Amphidinium_carterae.3